MVSVDGLSMRTNVNHWFVWCGRDADGMPDLAAQARLEEKNGIGLDLNYAHYDMNSNQSHHFLGPSGLNQGNFTGSGLIMKFADVNGRIIDVYQQLNAVYDQQYNESSDPEGFFRCFKGLMDRSLDDQVYSYISIKSHNDEYYFAKAPLMKMLTYANHHGVPVWTAVKLLDFIRMKDEASFSDITWSEQRLTFKLSSTLDHPSGLTILIPALHAGAAIADIRIDRQNRPIKTKLMRGNRYAMITVSPGRTYQISADYR
jgi:hypothetical protein